MAYTIRQYATKAGKRYEVRYRKPDAHPPEGVASNARWTPMRGERPM